MSTTPPAFMFDLRTWLRAHPALAALTEQRVFFRMPPSPSGSPFMRIYRVGGGVQPGEAPEFSPRIAHEVWGLMDSDYESVLNTVAALEALYLDADNVVMGSSTLLQYAAVTSAADSADPDTGWPRYVVDALLTLRSA